MTLEGRLQLYAPAGDSAHYNGLQNTRKAFSIATAFGVGLYCFQFTRIAIQQIAVTDSFTVPADDLTNRVLSFGWQALTAAVGAGITYLAVRGACAFFDSMLKPEIPEQEGWLRFQGYRAYAQMVRMHELMPDEDIILLRRVLPVDRQEWLAIRYAVVDAETLLHDGNRELAHPVLDGKEWYVERPDERVKEDLPRAGPSDKIVLLDPHRSPKSRSTRLAS